MTTAPASGRPRPSAAERTALAWLAGVLAVQMGCQVALLFETLAPFRVVFRTAAFAFNLFALVAVPGRAAADPLRLPAALAAGVVFLNVLHPTTNSPLAGLAHAALYLAVLAPVFWVPRLAVTPAVLARVLALVWGFQTASAAVGVLQTVYPGRFQPAVSTTVQGMGDLADSLKVELADGSVVWRPMGLTDTPGGAAAAGLYAAVFGMGYLTAPGRWWVRAAGAAGMAVGLYCVVLAQVRSILVVFGITAAAYAAWLGVLGRYREVAVLLAAGLAVAGGLLAAVAVGGEATSRRLETLVADRPDAVYQKNRGAFLDQTVAELLPAYPLGAGLGRWGMMRYYFGDEANPACPPIYVEIQWTAWLLDGGVPLVVLYAAAVASGVWAAARASARARGAWLATWAGLVAAYGVAVFGLTFNYVPFLAQSGMEFWFVTAAAAAAGRRGAG